MSIYDPQDRARAVGNAHDATGHLKKALEHLNVVIENCHGRHEEALKSLLLLIDDAREGLRSLYPALAEDVKQAVEEASRRKEEQP